MGIINAQDFFDERMATVLRGIPNVVNYRDDILGGGSDLKEYQDTLEKVLQRLQQHGLTLDPKKCQFNLNEVDFMGFRFTPEGIKASPDKIKALRGSKARDKGGTAEFCLHCAME